MSIYYIIIHNLHLISLRGKIFSGYMIILLKNYIFNFQVRFFMKTWAFVRSNLHRATKFKKDDDESTDSICPDFSHYLYFLFIPTLIYRDDYPR